MTYGRRGATRLSYREEQPRALVARICRENPRAGLEELKQLCLEAILASTKFYEALADYYVSNQVEYIMAEERRNKPSTTLREVSTRGTVSRKTATTLLLERREASVARTTAIVHAGVERLKLLGMLAPNGKPLAQCTIDECRKFGGWYMRLAINKPARAIVGDLYTEAELRAAQTWAD